MCLFQLQFLIQICIWVFLIELHCCCQSLSVALLCVCLRVCVSLCLCPSLSVSVFVGSHSIVAHNLFVGLCSVCVGYCDFIVCSCRLAFCNNTHLLLLASWLLYVVSFVFFGCNLSFWYWVMQLGFCRVVVLLNFCYPISLFFLWVTETYIHTYIILFTYIHSFLLLLRLMVECFAMLSFATVSNSQYISMHFNVSILGSRSQCSNLLFLLLLWHYFHIVFAH